MPQSLGVRESYKIKTGTKNYVSNRGTGKPVGHLRKKQVRKLRESSHPGTVPVVGTSPLTLAFARINSSHEDWFTKDSHDRLLLKRIIYSNQPFTAIEDGALREFLQHIQPKYNLPKTSDTIRSWVIRNYEEQKEEVQREIRNALTQIHVSIDG